MKAFLSKAWRFLVRWAYMALALQFVFAGINGFFLMRGVLLIDWYWLGVIADLAAIPAAVFYGTGWSFSVSRDTDAR